MLLWCCLWIGTVSLRLTGLSTWTQDVGAVLEGYGTFRKWGIGGGVGSLDVGLLQPGFTSCPLSSFWLWMECAQLPLASTTVPSSSQTVLQNKFSSLSCFPVKHLVTIWKNKQHRCTCLPSAQYHSQEHALAGYRRMKVCLELSWASLAWELKPD